MALPDLIRCHSSGRLNRRFGLGIKVLRGIVLIALAVTSVQLLANTIDEARTALYTHQYKSAHDVLLPLAIEGNSEAQYLLGMLYLRGQGVERNYSVASNWFGKSAEQGHPKAAFEMGKLYEFGKGSSQNLEQAIYFYQQAKAHGNAAAGKSLARVQGKQQGQLKHMDNDCYGLVKKGLISELKYFLGAYPDTLNKSSSGEEPLLTYAVRYGNPASVSLLLESGADSNTRDLLGVPAVIIAMDRKDSRILQLLLDAGADPDAAGPLGNTALHVAARTGDRVTAGLLLQSGANPRLLNDKGDTPLDVIGDEDDEMRLMFPSVNLPPASTGGSDIRNVGSRPMSSDTDVNNPYAGWPPINIAAWRGQTAQVRELMALMAVVDELDSGGLTALARAAFQGHVETVELLLEGGADINKPLLNQVTPFTIAAEKLQENVVLAMLSARDEVQLEDEHRIKMITQVLSTGGEPLATVLTEKFGLGLPKQALSRFLLIASRRGFSRIAQIFVANGASTDYQDSHGRSSLWWAVAGGFDQTIALLYNAGADPLQADKDGVTPIHLAAGRGYLPVVELFKSRMTTMDPATRLGVTPLMEAAIKGRIEVMQWLIAQGADIRRRDANSHTSLMLASRSDQLPAVRLLIASGANPDRRNKDGLNTKDIASATGAKSVIDYFSSQ